MSIWTIVLIHLKLKDKIGNDEMNTIEKLIGLKFKNKESGVTNIYDSIAN